MAALRKFTCVLRGLREISYHGHNLYPNVNVHRLCLRSAVTGGYSPVNTLKTNKVEHAKLLQGDYPRVFVSRLCSSEDKNTTTSKDSDKNLTLFQRFKAMYRDYWYVLLPVHVATSAVWFGGFYYAAKSGIDIVAFVEKLHLSESIVNKIKESGHSTAGYIAIAYALYKIFTPLRYTVTLGGTTISINYLKKCGYIKPIPKKEELQKMISEKRDSLRERRIALKNKVIGKLNQKKS